MSEYQFIIDTGAVSVDTADLLAQVQNEFKSALGPNINLAASTPQGTLITAETIARTNVMKNNAELANMTNPNLSYGTFLDSICSLLGVSRGADKSTVGDDVEFTGDPLTVIPAGSRIVTTSGNTFVTAAQITIPVGGVVLGTIKSEDFGQIQLPIGQLQIIDGTIGWAGAEVTVDSDITLGAVALSDTQLKTIRNKQLAIQGTGSSAAIQAAVLSVANVTSAKIIENNTGVDGIVNGVDFSLPSAVWVCVAGTANKADVAAALYEVHQASCPWDYGVASGTPVDSPNGTPVVDPSTGITYNVKFTTPIMYDCYINITVSQQTSASAAQPAVQNAILNYANGLLPVEEGFVVGASISAFEIAGAVASQLPGMYIKACTVACVPAGSPTPAYPAAYSTEFVMEPFEQATLQINNITVNVL